MHIQYLAPYLVGRGWEVVVLSFAGGPMWGAGSVEKIAGYSVYRPGRWRKWIQALGPDEHTRPARRFRAFARQSPRDFMAALGNARVIGQIAERHRVGLISAYHVMAALCAAWVAEGLRVPLVTTIFGEIFDRPSFYRRRVAEVRYVCEASRRVLSCSRHCAESLSLVDLAHPVETVYYGVDTRLFTPTNDAMRVRRRLGISAEDKVVVFVGRMESELGLHILLEAIPLVLEAHKDVRFIVGGRSGRLTDAARRHRRRLPRNLFVEADVPFGELPYLYAASTLAVVPSVNSRACLGLAIVEAMSTGKATIVADVGGGREIVEDRTTGRLVPPGDAAALAAAITGVLKEEGDLRGYGRAARSRAVGAFDMRETNRRMEEVFLEAVA